MLILSKVICNSVVSDGTAATRPCNSLPCVQILSHNTLLQCRLLLCPGRGAEYCDQLVCLCVCASACLYVCLSVCEHISGTAGLNFTIFCVQISWSWLGPPWWRCHMLCTSGSMDEVTFGHSGPGWPNYYH